MKVAPVLARLRKHGQVRQVLVHTGQHYDVKMSDVFFQDLGMPQPDVHLGVGSGSHALQTARVMIEVEPVLARERPEVVVVAGDVDSTVAVALVAAKMGIPIAHIEAGLRSRDWTMPEEINRVLTDRLSDLLFTPSRDGDENLRKEGIDPERVHFVGNVMIDSLHAALPRARESRIRERLELSRRGMRSPPCTARRTSTIRPRSRGCSRRSRRLPSRSRSYSPSIPARARGCRQDSSPVV